MVKIGTIKRGRDIGYKSVKQAFIWAKCPECALERWVEVRKIKAISVSIRCGKCANKATGKQQRGKNSPHWKGGRINALGYIYLWISPDDFFYPMAVVKAPSSGIVAEHRLVMAKHLGRCLHSWEIIHHLNGIRNDNRLKNLGIVSSHNHSSQTLKSAFQKRIRDLEAELAQRNFKEL